ncbi:hypothetical protein Micbo1qcDRAFT_37547 [Microdochium bolleyi]|uniref:Uncharacterized protein n=1 Tax=Microdochium bolleyi TaxID=196109 RepID=A0A136IMA7_9PEZI|nr:hypothetical protein Micbo1qcDRAFT_37547 [Microdochium bolleyi]
MLNACWEYSKPVSLHKNSPSREAIVLSSWCSLVFETRRHVCRHLASTDAAQKLAGRGKEVVFLSTKWKYTGQRLAGGGPVPLIVHVLDHTVRSLLTAALPLSLSLSLSLSLQEALWFTLAVTSSAESVESVCACQVVVRNPARRQAHTPTTTTTTTR